MDSRLKPSSDITDLKGVGSSFEEKLQRLGISKIIDLLNHYPTRYLDYTKPVQIRDLQEKAASVFVATLTTPKAYYTKTGKFITESTAIDDTGKIKIIWFNNPYIKRLIRENETYTIAGKPSFWSGKLCFISPTIEDGNSISLNTRGLVPIYPQTEGVTSRWLRQKINLALESVDLEDPLSNHHDPYEGCINIKEAYKMIHFPSNNHQRWLSDKRLSFNEHTKINLTNILENQQLGKALKHTINNDLFHHHASKLPFSLTSTQQKAITQLFADLATEEPTHRLIQGETGSGKTITIIMAADQVLNNGYSVALMAPTEILAQQHAKTYEQLGSFPQNSQLITASSHHQIVTDKPMIYIGTHALLNQIPANLTHPLSLVVIDEQHKFGVRQRHELQSRTPLPHVVNLSATPIPRTVALGLLGDIETTTIDSKPGNRLPTKTFIVSPTRYNQSTPWLTKNLSEGNSLFVVCPTINERGRLSSVESIGAKYKKLFPQHRVFILHGKLSKESQQQIIEEFRSTPSCILVATSLIEVGIDIPSANIMTVHSAEMFGLAQLHQLRGRVGRGGAQGYFFAVPTSDEETATERLKLLQKYDSGLKLAQKDLRLRGAGEVFGEKQHGLQSVRLKYFWSKKLYTEAKKLAKNIIAQDVQEAATLLGKLESYS